jgi:hypothetical protein
MMGGGEYSGCESKPPTDSLPDNLDDQDLGAVGILQGRRTWQIAYR